MKKLWILVLVALMLIVSVAPVAASGGQPTNRPPGWSQQNPGNGGSAGPGNG